MEHHVCKGTCEHVSDNPGMCGTDGCTNQGKPFEKCDCGDASSHGAGDGGGDESTSHDNE